MQLPDNIIVTCKFKSDVLGSEDKFGIILDFKTIKNTTINEPEYIGWQEDSIQAIIMDEEGKLHQRLISDITINNATKIMTLSNS